jgi:hypothetical protein
MATLQAGQRLPLTNEHMKKEHLAHFVYFDAQMRARVKTYTSGESKTVGVVREGP